MKQGYIYGDGVYTRDGHKIHIGDWISDTSGIYEITTICPSEDKIYGDSVIFSDTDPDMYSLEDHHIWTCKEIAHFYKEF